MEDFLSRWYAAVLWSTRSNPPIPMDTSLSIRHRFNVNIPRGKFVVISLILIGESTWNLWHRFDVEILTWIRRPLKLTKYRWRGFFYVVSTSNRRNFCMHCFHFLTFSALGTCSKLIMLSRCNFSDIYISL